MSIKAKEERLFQIVCAIHDVEVELFDRAGNDFDEILAKQLKKARIQLEKLKGEIYA